GKGVRFLVDKLAHASLIDAVRGSGARFRVFSHNQLGKLRRLLEEREAGQLQVVVSESIFSMDGDAADLQGLAALKRQQPFALLLDEAHASGVYGKHGAGYAAERGLAGIADVSVITLSKAMGCMGGAVCASSAFVETLVNYAPAFIFSTNISPMMAAGAKAAIGVMREEPGRQERVRALALRVRREWEGLGCEIPAGDSPIIPLILGTEGRALAAAEKLRERGMIVPAVRPPSVPRNGSRLRVTLCCEHRDEEVELLIKAVREEIAGS
ncbi:MAG TPA: aminotransferase class I/II-fold pyridoxal phosphate-dependent enzyme, partial [Tepidisphaeraceae bacterium]